MSPEVMDVNRDGLHSSGGQFSYAGSMDTSWGGNHAESGQVKIPGLLFGEDDNPSKPSPRSPTLPPKPPPQGPPQPSELPLQPPEVAEKHLSSPKSPPQLLQQPPQLLQQPPQPPVRERPREDDKEDGGGDIHDAPSQLAPLPDPASSQIPPVSQAVPPSQAAISETLSPSQSPSTTQTVPPLQLPSTSQAVLPPQAPPSHAVSQSQETIEQSISTPPNTLAATALTSQTTAPPQLSEGDAPLIRNPLLSSNLISLYGLDGLAATVARTDPQTGEKINKMRKSYEGQLKSFALSGRNKSVKHDPSKGMGLSEMAAWPEEEWRNQKVFGKDVKDGLPDALKAKLEKAMAMSPGPVPENDKWEDLLGIDKVKTVDAKEKGAKNNTIKPSGQPNNVNRPFNVSNHESQAPESDRPTRKNKRRDYYSLAGGDSDDDGYLSGESRSTKNSAGHRKRRKTKDFDSTTEYSGSRNNSFAAGPVGIRASYGR